IPAQLTRTSSRPNCSTPVSTAFWVPPGAVTSVRQNSPASPSSRATCCPRSSLTSATTTRAPCSAYARQIAAPMPLPPPVTTATLSSNLNRATGISPLLILYSCGPIHAPAHHVDQLTAFGQRVQIPQDVANPATEGIAGDSGQMRSHQNVVQRRKGQPAGFALPRFGWVLVPHVDRGASDAVSAKCLEQRLLVDYGARSEE